MSPDNHSLPPGFRRWLDCAGALSGISNELGRLANEEQSDFRGWSVMLGSAGDYLCIVRRYDADGAPVILFSSGDDPLSAMMNVDKVLAARGYRPDKKAR